VVLEGCLDINPRLRTDIRAINMKQRLPKAQPQTKPRAIGPKFLQDPEDMLDLTKPGGKRIQEK